MDYKRPTLTEEERKNVLKFAQKINNVKMAQRFTVIARLLSENAALAKECNEHRAARGFDPLPTYDPKES